MVEISAAGLKLLLDWVAKVATLRKGAQSKKKVEKLTSTLYKEALQGNNVDLDRIEALLEQLQDTEPTPELCRIRRVLNKSVGVNGKKTKLVSARKPAAKPMKKKTATKKNVSNEIKKSELIRQRSTARILKTSCLRSES